MYHQFSLIWNIQRIKRDAILASIIMSSFEMLNSIMILCEQISRLGQVLLIELMQNKITINLFESFHFSTTTV